MSAPPEQATEVLSPGRVRAFPFLWTKALRFVAALLVLVWVLLPLVPEETGLRFGLGFRIFFTAIIVLSALFFWFLEQERIPYPRSALGVFVSAAAVYIATVGFLVAVATIAPQFGLPRPEGEAGELQGAERGKALFFRDDVGCFRCHMVAGTGGTRGPDLTHVAGRAGQRVPNLPAERYLLEKVRAGATYQFLVPEYVPMMPAFGQMLSEEQVADLVAFLLSLQ